MENENTNAALDQPVTLRQHLDSTNGLFGKLVELQKRVQAIEICLHENGLVSPDENGAND